MASDVQERSNLLKKQRLLRRSAPRNDRCSLSEWHYAAVAAASFASSAAVGPDTL